MKVEWRIAWRYLKAKKSIGAINIVSGVSAVSVGIVTAAMVCVFSVMNGFGSLIEQMFSQFDPELRIVAAQGKCLSLDDDALRRVAEMPEVAIFSPTIEETALVSFHDKQVPARLKGVDSLYQALTNIDTLIMDGKYQVYDGAFERCVPGIGLANTLTIGAHFISGVHIYAPERKGRVNLLRPDEGFRQATTFISGIFTVSQSKYDDSYMLVSLNLARYLFDYSDTEATAVELKLTDGTKMRTAKRQIAQILGDRYVVLDRYEQQEDFFRILSMEKLLTALLLIFILLIACFNSIGSLSMLIIDKQEDIRTMSNIGASERQIQHVFLLEGWFVSLLGAVGGLMVGLVLCLIQQHFGLLKLGNGVEYVINTYPVQVQVLDLLWVLLIVLAISGLTSWIPAKKIRVKEK